jgi:hypothetical protein
MTQEEIEALMNDTIMDSSGSSDEHDIDALLAGIDGVVDDGKDSNDFNGNIDDLLAGIDGIVDTDEKDDQLNQTDMEALLAGIDGMVDDKPAPTPKSDSKKESSLKHDDDSLGAKIDKGINRRHKDEKVNRKDKKDL